MKHDAEDKSERILSIYSRLKEGRTVGKTEVSDTFGVNPRTIQRDISDIQNFLKNQNSETGEIQEIVYDREAGGYRLQTKIQKHLQPKELLAVCKVLLESRSLVTEEMAPIIHKLINTCSEGEDRKLIRDYINNELHHYNELHHGKKLLDRIWELEKAVREELSEKVFSNDNITAISGLASLRDADKKEMEQYVQGLEHLTDSLKGRNYSIVVIADPVSADAMNLAKNGYESLYTQLSPFLNTSMSFNETDSLSVTNFHTEGVSHTVGESVSLTQNYTRTSGWNHSNTHSVGSSKDTGRSLGTMIGVGLGAAAAIVLTGGTATPLVLAGVAAAGAGIGATAGGAAGDTLIGSHNKNDADSSGENGGVSEGSAKTSQNSIADAENKQDTQGKTEGKTHGRTLQFTSENRSVKDLLQRIDKSVERLEKCESFGAFNCAAYVISSDPETNAVVANGYSALMKGENSFLQSSYINQWTSADAGEKSIKEYLKKFSHPTTMYLWVRYLTASKDLFHLVA